MWFVVCGSSLIVVCRLLFVDDAWLCTECSLLFWVSQLFVAYCLLFVDRCWCMVVHGLVLAVRCLLFVGCCSTIVDWSCLSLLIVGCCWLLT